MRIALAIALVLAAAPAEAKPKHGAHAAEAPDKGDKGDKPDKPKHPRGWPLPSAGPTASGDPELIFTFDDGPNPKTTPAVLDALAKHHIHAIFFMVGEMADSKNAKDLVDRIVSEGHIVANHTMTHQDLCRIKDDDRAAREIDLAKTAIEKASKLELAWFRTPYGVRCERVENLLSERKLDHFHWDLDPQEWKHGSAQKAIDYVEKQVGKMTGRDVLLMHDIKKATAESLPVILDWIDEENARRKTDHKRRIRIIQGYELAVMRLPDGEAGWIADAASAPARLGKDLASLLP